MVGSFDSKGLVTVERWNPNFYTVSFPLSDHTVELEEIIKGIEWFKTLPVAYRDRLLEFANHDYTIADWPIRGGGTISKLSYKSNGERVITLIEKHDGKRGEIEKVEIDPKDQSKVLHRVAERIACDFICDLFAATFDKVNQHTNQTVFHGTLVPFPLGGLDWIRPLIKDRGNTKEGLVELLNENNRLSEICIRKDLPPQGNLSTCQYSIKVAEELSEAWYLINQDDKKFIDGRLPLKN